MIWLVLIVILGLTSNSALGISLVVTDIDGWIEDQSGWTEPRKGHVGIRIYYTWDLSLHVLYILMGMPRLQMKNSLQLLGAGRRVSPHSTSSSATDGHVGSWQVSRASQIVRKIRDALTRSTNASRWNIFSTRQFIIHLQTPRNSQAHWSDLQSHQQFFYGKSMQCCQEKLPINCYNVSRENSATSLALAGKIATKMIEFGDLPKVS